MVDLLLLFRVSWFLVCVVCIWVSLFMFIEKFI